MWRSKLVADMPGQTLGWRISGEKCFERKVCAVRKASINLLFRFEKYDRLVAKVNIVL